MASESCSATSSSSHPQDEKDCRVVLDCVPPIQLITLVVGSFDHIGNLGIAPLSAGRGLILDSAVHERSHICSRKVTKLEC